LYACLFLLQSTRFSRKEEAVYTRQDASKLKQAPSDRINKIPQAGINLIAALTAGMVFPLAVEL
jgi:hypothetical protein